MPRKQITAVRGPRWLLPVAVAAGMAVSAAVAPRSASAEPVDRAVPAIAGVGWAGSGSAAGATDDNRVADLS